MNEKLTTPNTVGVSVEFYNRYFPIYFRVPGVIIYVRNELL